MSATPAGWYADATDPGLVRWWDGDAWTEYTQPNPQAVAPPAPTAPAAPEPPLNYPPPAFSTPDLVSPAAPVTASPRRAAGASLPISEPVRLVPPAARVTPAEPATTSGSFAVAPLATATPMPASASTPWTSSPSFAQPTGSVDLASVEYEPMTRSWGSSHGSTSGRTVTGVTTGGAWMLALSPWFTLGFAALGWWLIESGTSGIAPFVGGGIGVISLLWILVGAITDYRRLGALGHEFRPSVAWIVLGPFFYLMARAIHVYRTTRSGTAPTWVYLISAVVVGAIAGALSLLIPRDAELTELRAVESTIASELQQQGLDYTVLCPSETSASLGNSFVCTAYDEVGPAAIIRVTWTGFGGSFVYELETTAATASR